MAHDVLICPQLCTQPFFVDREPWLLCLVKEISWPSHRRRLRNGEACHNLSLASHNSVLTEVQFSNQRISKDVKVSPYSDIRLHRVWVSGLDKSQFMTRAHNTTLSNVHFCQQRKWKIQLKIYRLKTQWNCWLLGSRNGNYTPAQVTRSCFKEVKVVVWLGWRVWWEMVIKNRGSAAVSLRDAKGNALLWEW